MICDYKNITHIESSTSVTQNSKDASLDFNLLIILCVSCGLFGIVVCVLFGIFKIGRRSPPAPVEQRPAHPRTIRFLKFKNSQPQSEPFISIENENYRQF